MVHVCIHRASRLLIGLWAPALLLGCGPQIELETTTEASDGTGPMDTTATTIITTTGPTTTMGPTTTPPPVTTDDTLDTGVFDTGEVWMDLPEDCSTFAQDCPPGYKCMPWANDGGGAWNDTRCVPIAEDPGAPGDPCTVEGDGTSGIDDCELGSMCWDVDPETNMGTCVAQCIGDEADPGCADPCSSCAIGGDGAITLCLPLCDPILQNCNEGQACYPINQSFACAPDASPRDAMIGTPCEFINVCPPGLMCMNASDVPGCDPGGIGCCTPVCPADGADPCPGLLPGSECQVLFPEGIGDGERCLTAEPGVCLMP